MLASFVTSISERWFAELFRQHQSSTGDSIALLFTSLVKCVLIIEDISSTPKATELFSPLNTTLKRCIGNFSLLYFSSSRGGDKSKGKDKRGKNQNSDITISTTVYEALLRMCSDEIKSNSNSSSGGGDGGCCFSMITGIHRSLIAMGPSVSNEFNADDVRGLISFLNDVASALTVDDGSFDSDYVMGKKKGLLQLSITSLVQFLVNHSDHITGSDLDIIESSLIDTLQLISALPMNNYDASLSIKNGDDLVTVLNGIIATPSVSLQVAHFFLSHTSHRLANTLGDVLKAFPARGLTPELLLCQIILSDDASERVSLEEKNIFQNILSSLTDGNDDKNYITSIPLERFTIYHKFTLFIF